MLWPACWRCWLCTGSERGNYRGRTCQQPDHCGILKAQQSPRMPGSHPQKCEYLEATHCAELKSSYPARNVHHSTAQ
jgi:hypothetical protein